MTTTNTDLTTTKSNLPASLVMPEMGGVVADDLNLGRYVLVQGAHELSSSGKCSSGDIYDTAVQAVVGGRGKKIELIFVHMEKDIKLVELDPSTMLQLKMGERRVVPATDDLVSHGKEVLHLDGKKWKVVYRHKYFAILPSGLEKLPVIIVFQGTSIWASKRIITITMNADRVLMNRVFALDSIMQNGKAGAYFQLDAKAVRDTDIPEKQAALKWYNHIQSGKAKISDADDSSPF